MSRRHIHPQIAPGILLPVPASSPPPPEREFLRPAYAERFRCISSACEDTCCQGWAVPIDRVTYEKYRSIDALKQHLGTLIVLNSATSTTADFARIPLTAKATCPFLSTDQLCGIQKDFGAQALSHTCATYPRAVSTIATQREEALNLSCPEAARLTLLDPNLLGDRAPAAACAPFGGLDSQLAIREAVLSLVTFRDYPLWQRMYLLGILARRLEALSGARAVADWATANPTTVRFVLADTDRVATLKRLRPTMDDIRPQTPLQIQIVLELVRTRLAQPPVPTRFVQCVQNFESGLRCNNATCEQDILTAHTDAHRLYFQPLMDRHPHLLENYLINSIFKNHYPFTHPRDHNPDLQHEQPDAESEHMVLCTHLAILQTLLIGMAGHYREAFDTHHVVTLVQSFARTFEHSRESQAQIKTLIRKHKLNRLSGIALMLQV